MSILTLTALTMMGMAILLAGVVFVRPGLVRRRGGRAVIFTALFVFPVAVSTLALNVHLERSKSTEFCLSCHVMEPYGESMLLDDSDYLPAGHFQNGRIPRDHACFTCHTSYTMFGDVNAKMQGLKHVWVYYFGDIPEKIELYSPYLNRECLHCHGGSRSFEESDLHIDIRAELENDDMSCLECHDMVHPVEQVDDLPKWEEASLVAADME